MATKIQLEAMVRTVLKLQMKGETVHGVNFNPIYLLIYTASGNMIRIDTDGEEF